MIIQSLLRFCFLSLLALTLVACGSKVELMASMPESDANEVLAALVSAGISAKKIPGKEGMVGLAVDATEVGRAVDLLRTKGLPRERFAGMGEVFKKEGLISSPMEERARYIHALSQELRGTLAEIDGVLAARVHVVLPERSNAGDPPTPSSAAVFIKHQEGYNLDTIQPQIRKLVLNSIPSLIADKVSIVLVSAQTASAKSNGTPVPPPLQGFSPAIVTVLFLLLLVSLSVTGFVLWKFWWPTRQATEGSRN